MGEIVEILKPYRYSSIPVIIIDNSIEYKVYACYGCNGMYIFNVNNANGHRAPYNYKKVARKFDTFMKRKNPLAKLFYGMATIDSIKEIENVQVMNDKIGLIVSRNVK